MNKWLRVVCKILLWTFAVLAVATGAFYLWMQDYLDGAPFVEVGPAMSLTSEFPSAENWDETALEKARHYGDSIGSTAFILIAEGAIVAEWGETDLRSSVHSVRKSLMSALYGIAVSKGVIDTNATLGELGFDDVNPPLNDLEKSARIVDLLMARSGIYHNSVKSDTERNRPARGSHAPDEEFFYNNWSFNALGGMFEQMTGLSMGEAFKTWIADPIGMLDFRVEDVIYTESPASVYPAYRFYVSARDLARFGLLYLNGGQWKGQQIIDREWIVETSKARSQLDDIGYGFLWWVKSDSSILASGTGGQKILVDQKRNLVTVNKVNTGKGFTRGMWWEFGSRVNNREFTHLIDLVMEGKPHTAAIEE